MIFNVGISDLPYTTESYTVWHSMLRRCYSSVYHEGKPTYVGTQVENTWKTHSNFAKWFRENYVNGWQLDKDLLGDGKLYSESTCCFLPGIINSAISNTGFNGVHWKKKNNKWVAQMSAVSNGKRKGVHLLITDSKQEAAQRYQEVKGLYIIMLAEKYKDRLKLNVFNKLIEISKLGE